VRHRARGQIVPFRRAVAGRCVMCPEPCDRGEQHPKCGASRDATQREVPVSADGEGDRGGNPS